VESSEGERTYDSEMALEAFGTCTEETVRGSLRGTIGMEGIDGIVFAAWATLAGVDQAGRDMDEVAILDLAGRVEEGDGCGDVDVNLIKPAYSGGTDA